MLEREEKGLALRVLGVRDVLVLGPGAGRESSEDVVGGREGQEDCIGLACAHLVKDTRLELVLGPSKHQVYIFYCLFGAFVYMGEQRPAQLLRLPHILERRIQGHVPQHHPLGGFSLSAAISPLKLALAHTASHPTIMINLIKQSRP